MTFIYNTQAQVKLICDVCAKQTGFCDTMDELLEAVHFGEPITNDYGSVSWVYGPGAKFIGAGFQPMITVNTRTHACPSCKSNFESLVYTEQPKSIRAKVGHLGDPAKTSRNEDLEMNKTITPLFRGSVSKYPRVFPTSEPDMSHDKSLLPQGDADSPDV